jgi:hypothetical protein
VHFDVARGQVGVAHRRWPSDDFALDEDDGLRTDGLRAAEDFRGGPSRPERHLDEPIAIAQVEEDDASEVAAPVDPAP